MHSQLGSQAIQSADADYRHENRLFFENAPTDWLLNLSKVKGLQNNCDLRLIESHISKHLSGTKHAALELGFGYGRVLRWLREKNPSKRIYGVDHSDRFCSMAKQNFQNDPGTILLNCLATEFKVSEPLDLALWMWAGFFELSKADKETAMKAVSANLIKGGQFVVEFPDQIIGHESIEERQDGMIRVNTEFGNLNVFKGSASAITQLAEMVGFRLTVELSYLTMTAIPRRILIFEKL